MDHLPNLQEIHLAGMLDSGVVQVIKALDKDIGAERMSSMELSWKAKYGINADGILAGGEKISQVPPSLRRRFKKFNLVIDILVDDEGLSRIIEEVGKLRPTYLKLWMTAEEPAWHMSYEDLNPENGRLETLIIGGDYQQQQHQQQQQQQQQQQHQQHVNQQGQQYIYQAPPSHEVPYFNYYWGQQQQQQQHPHQQLAHQQQQHYHQ
ncbi:hypothetical protein SAMD00019534_008260 [Acytostelium subglobosum LB1]|uniref:hypothetical protein n=1 Tax=Acytostelium subglobosum LB1 TaxID=1410327 RepID=UPI0006449811|nr:hypothetical protein SAMD00019534_008260 [Acytostelium subglobosum LB1]GAM17651.1 hypothetical protein SAMD00019534_008260 [Acytostelium subglobosum LB1]|eukprot:XP_012758247.1 hypothetical protein SAMD00019534_008260 [Acytostelium subglobosum LB1]